MDTVITLLLAYKYYVMFPIAIFEGPVLAVVGGVLVMSGIINPVYLYIILVLGDMVGDSIYYTIGRMSKNMWSGKLGRFFGVTEEKLIIAKEYFSLHRKKALVLSKVIHGIGVAGLFAAGNLRINYFRFVYTCMAVSIVQSALLLVIGMFFGNAYQQIGTYLDYFAATTVVIGFIIILFLVLKRLKLFER